MHNHYDIIIVGGRCGGSATAIGLGRTGYRVLLIERQKMPSDTLSTHVLWPDGIRALDRLGVLDAVLATGAPPAHHFRLCHGADVTVTPLTPHEGVDYFLCPSRRDLDGILFDTAQNTPGVDAFDQTRFIGLRWNDGRVSGARLSSQRSEHVVTADLVIGADGRDSTVARAAGAVEDDVVEPGRYWYYGYFAGSHEPEPAAMTDSGTPTETAASMAMADGLRMVAYAAFNEDYATFRQRHRENYLARLMAHPFIAEMLAGAHLVSPVYGIAGVRGFYRTPSGRGWALVGDAAHLKDPIVARGINDALLAAEDLTLRLTDGISDCALGRYGAWLRERTRTTSRMARMLARPDRFMSASQAEILSRELGTPEGLARIVGLEYGVTQFEELFVTEDEKAVEVSADR